MRVLICSLKECEKPILGMGVLLRDEFHQGIRWEEAYNSYHLENAERGPSEVVIVHPNCFMALFSELTRKESESSFAFVLASTESLREGIGFDEGVEDEQEEG